MAARELNQQKKRHEGWIEVAGVTFVVFVPSDWSSSEPVAVAR